MPQVKEAIQSIHSTSISGAFRGRNHRILRATSDEGKGCRHAFCGAALSAQGSEGANDKRGREKHIPMVESGTAAMVRQSGNIFDIATAISSRSNSAPGTVKQHRVHSQRDVSGGQLVQSRSGYGRAAYRFAMARARLPGSTQLKKSCAYGITIDVIHCQTTFVPSGLAPSNVSHLRSSSTIYFSILPFQVTGSAFS